MTGFGGGGGYSICCILFFFLTKKCFSQVSSVEIIYSKTGIWKLYSFNIYETKHQYKTHKSKMKIRDPLLYRLNICNGQYIPWHLLLTCQKIRQHSHQFGAGTFMSYWLVTHLPSACMVVYVMKKFSHWAGKGGNKQQQNQKHTALILNISIIPGFHKCCNTNINLINEFDLTVT